MADPLTVALLAGTALKVIDGYQQASSIVEAAEKNKRLAEETALGLELDAYDRERYGRTSANRYHAAIAYIQGSQAAILESRGSNITLGTSAALLAETRLTGELNKIDIQEQSRKQAYGLRSRALNVRLTGDVAHSNALDRAQSTRESALLRGGVEAFNTLYATSNKKIASDNRLKNLNQRRTKEM